MRSSSRVPGKHLPGDGISEPGTREHRKVSRMAALTPARMGVRAAQREHQRIGTDFTRRVEIFDVIEDERIWLLFQHMSNLYGAYNRYGDAIGIIINSLSPGHRL